MFQLLFVNSIICLASEFSSYPEGEATKIAENYEYIFIGTVINKTRESNSTQYVFNVTKYLKHPLNSTEIYLTGIGGLEIAKNPTKLFFLDKEYILFFTEIDENYRILGFDYTAIPSSWVRPREIEHIRNPEILDVMVGGVGAEDEAEDASDSEPIKSYLFYPILICLGGFFAILFSIIFLIQYLRARTERTGKPL